jgi:hypothetical protein
MESHYEINVAARGSDGRARHLFATAPRSCVTLSDMKRVRAHIESAFPASEGYEVTVTHWRCEGSMIASEVNA